MPFKQAIPADDTAPDDEGAFSSFLRYVGRPGKIVQNLLMGNLEGAGRQAGDILGDTVDAFLPGNLIPQFSRKQDSPEFSDVIGGMDEGIGKTAVDILGGMATDPLTYVGLGPLLKGANLAGKGALSVAKSVAPRLTEQGLEGAATVGRGLRSMAGAQKVAKPYAEIVDKANAAGRAEASAGLRAGEQAVAGLSEGERAIVSDIVRNELVEGRAVKPLTEGGDLAARIAAHPGVTPESAARIQKAAEDAIAIGQSQAKRPGIFWKPGEAMLPGAEKLTPEAQAFLKSLPAEQRSVLAKDVAHLAANPDPAGEVGNLQQALSFKLEGGKIPAAAEAPKDVLAGLSDEYLPRRYEGIKADAKLGQELGNPSAIKESMLREPEQISEFLAKNPDVLYERDVAKLLAPRAEQQGVLARRADIGKGIVDKMKSGEIPLPYKEPDKLAFAKSLLGKDYAHADSQFRTMVNDHIKELMKVDPETGKYVYDAYNGMDPRGAILGLLAKTNSVVKPMMTAGVFLPKLGFNVRNAVSGVWQTMSNPATRGQTGAQLRRLASDLGGAMSDAVHDTFGLKLPKDAQAAGLRAVDDAFAASQGSAENAMNLLRQGGREMEAEAVQHGVLDGFVSSEEMLRTMQAKPWVKTLKSVAMWPTKIMQGLESRMRFGLYKELRAAGQSAEEAAKNVGESLFKYDVSSAANRTMRDLVPFSQYMAKAIPQQAKFFAEGSKTGNIALSGVVHAYDAAEQDSIYPWMQGKLNLPIGEGEGGNQNYISGFGLPFEALSNIPNPSASPREFGRDVERNILGSAHPLLKTGFGLISGEDPFTEQPFLGYDKVPLLGAAGDFGRGYNAIAGTGLLQPIDSPIRQIDKALDDRRGPGVRALDLTTGANVVSVDPDRARQLQMTEAIKQDPSVGQYTGFYAKPGDEASKQAVAELNQLNQRLRAEQKAKLSPPAAAEATAPEQPYKINRGPDRRVQSVEVGGVTYEVTRDASGRAEMVAQKKSGATRFFKAHRNERGDIQHFAPATPSVQ